MQGAVLPFQRAVLHDASTTGFSRLAPGVVRINGDNMAQRTMLTWEQKGAIVFYKIDDAYYFVAGVSNPNQAEFWVRQLNDAFMAGREFERSGK